MVQLQKDSAVYDVYSHDVRMLCVSQKHHKVDEYVGWRFQIVRLFGRGLDGGISSYGMISCIMLMALACVHMAFGCDSDGHLRRREIALVQLIHARVSVTKHMSGEEKRAFLIELQKLNRGLELCEMSISEGLIGIYQICACLAEYEGKACVYHKYCADTVEGDMAHNITLVERMILEWDRGTHPWHVWARSIKHSYGSYVPLVAPWVMVPIVALAGIAAHRWLEKPLFGKAMLGLLIDPAVRILHTASVRSYVKDVLVPAVTYAVAIPVALLCGDAMPRFKSVLKYSGKPLSSLVSDEHTYQFLKDYAQFLQNETVYSSQWAGMRHLLCIEGLDASSVRDIACSLAHESNRGYVVWNAASLLEKSFKEKLEDLRAHAPCVVIIEGIDWMFRNMERGSDMWIQKIAECMEVLSSYASTDSSKGVMLVFTVQNAQDIPSEIMAFAGGLVSCGALECEKVLGESVFRRYGVRLSEEALQKLSSIAVSHGMTVAEDSVKAAFTRAQLNKTSFTSDTLLSHLNQSSIPTFTNVSISSK